MADTADSRAAYTAYTLSHDIDGRKNRIGLLVEEQVIVAEVRTGEVPVEVLRLDIERERIGKERVDGLGNGLCFLRRQVSHCRQLRGCGERLDVRFRCLSGCHALSLPLWYVHVVHAR